MAGIADINVIDLVGQDAPGNYLVIMVEPRPWGTDPDQPAQLREKINTYVGFITDGSLAARYPETKEGVVDIQLNCPPNPNPEITKILEHASTQLHELGIGFRINIQK